MWALWTTRNQLVFESRHQSPLAVVSRAMADAQEWKRAQFTSDPPRTIQKGIAFALTPTVPQGKILCNSDAAWNQASESTGLGWIFTPPGSPTLQGSQHQTHVQSALLAEALASDLLFNTPSNLATLKSGSDQTLLCSFEPSLRSQNRRSSTQFSRISKLYHLHFLSASSPLSQESLMGQQTFWQKLLFVI